MGGDRRFDATPDHHHVAAFATPARKLNLAELPPEADQISLAEIVDPTPERGKIEAPSHASTIAGRPSISIAYQKGLIAEISP